MQEGFLDIFSAFLAVSGLGILFGIGLAYASKVFAVKKDELIEELEDALPGLNCGACGYAGCSSYAEVIAGGDEEDLTLCAPGGEPTAFKIAELMGKEVSFNSDKKVAQVFCKGDRETSTYQFDYNGIKDCNALYALYGGDKTCPFGCLGLGSCIKVCPTDAIKYYKKGLVFVEKDMCITCGKCVDICPTGVMQMLPLSADCYVACNSTDKAGKVRKYCKVGCTGCTLCVKKSPEGGFFIENFLSRIDYSKNGERKAASEKCPPKCIVKNKEI